MKSGRGSGSKCEGLGRERPGVKESGLEGQDVKLRWAGGAFDSFVCKRDEVF